MTTTLPSLETIVQAHKRIAPFIHRTPVLRSTALDEKAACQLFFKCENFQKVGAFKMRGATNAILQLDEAEKSKGVVTHSSGNHAQAVALAAKLNGIKATIVMPNNAPEVKKAAVAAYGADIIFCEPTLAARESTVEAFIQKTGATFIHPYDNDHIICGQASAAKELLEDEQDFDFLLTPIGGGGLLAGTALSAHYLSPKTVVIGSEPQGADDAYRSFKAGELIPQTAPNTIADGLLTSLGRRNFTIITSLVSDIITVSDEEIIAAMRMIWERMKIIIEPSCAVPFAAVLKDNERFQGKKVGIILSGGNVDLSRLPF